MAEYILLISTYRENFAPTGGDFQPAGSFAEGAGGVAGFDIHVAFFSFMQSFMQILFVRRDFVGVSRFAYPLYCFFLT